MVRRLFGGCLQKNRSTPLTSLLPLGPPPQGIAEKLKDGQKVIEEKVYHIWTVLSAFEESSAACISDMLLHVSNGSYLQGVRMAESFVKHIRILFASIDDIEAQLAVFHDQQVIRRELKELQFSFIHTL